MPLSGDFMKVVILAAGMGKRLGLGIPKPLVKIYRDKTILDHQLYSLRKIVNFSDILLVIGYKGELIQRKYPFLSYVYNCDYKETNTAKSLLIGLESLESEGDDVLWLNGDVVFDPEIMSLIEKNKGENLVAVNIDENVGSEEVKYTLTPDGYIKEVSKNVRNPLGEAVGINQVNKESLPILIESLRECQDQDYFEKGIEKSIRKGVKFKPLCIGDKFCVEVDFKEDLQKVREWAKKYYEGQ